MLIINNEIDLGKSFERLKMELDHSHRITSPENPESYAYALGRLQSAIRVHIKRCVGDIPDLPKDTPAINIDDIKDIL